MGSISAHEIFFIIFMTKNILCVYSFECIDRHKKKINKSHHEKRYSCEDNYLFIQRPLPINILMYEAHMKIMTVPKRKQT